MSCDKHGKSKGLCPVSFGFAWGIVLGLMMMFFIWAAWLWGYGASVVDMYASIFPGISASFLGGVVSGLWGLLEGFILGFFIALIYDVFSCCCKCRCCRDEHECKHEHTCCDHGKSSVGPKV